MIESMMTRQVLTCTLTELDSHRDDRGHLIPVWDAKKWSARYMYASWTHPQQCRDADRWHVHQVQTDNFIVLVGNFLVALSDGQDLVRISLQESYPRLLSIPPGIYHCFKNYWHKDSLLINLPSEGYDPQDEGRVPFSDLKVGKPW